MNANADIHPADLTQFISHSHWVPAHSTLGEAHQRLMRQDCEYIAVLDRQRVMGIGARAQFEICMGMRSGYALCVQQPVTQHLLPEYIQIPLQTPLDEVLRLVSERPPSRFHDDIALTDEHDCYLGLISVRNLLLLQHRNYQQIIAQLQRKQYELDAKTRRREKHLLLARQLQQAILPRHFPTFPAQEDAASNRIRFFHHYQSADLLSGDFFYVIPVHDDCAGVFVCDVQGSGVGSALMTAMIRALVDGHAKTASSPGNLLTTLNARFCHLMQDYPDSIFVTAAYLVLDLALGRYQLASAGHPVPIRVDRTTHACSFMQPPLELVGPPIGIAADALYGTAEGRLQGPEFYLLYTDGLYEVFGIDKQPFGHDRLIETAARHAMLAPDAFFKRMIEEIEGYSATGRFVDDVCMVGVEVKPKTAQESPMRAQK